MKASVFHKPGDIRVDTVPDPTIRHPQDVILKVTSTAICGSDLHIYNGFLPQKRPMVLGHEFMGIVEDAGPEVTTVTKGDRVVIPFPIACGHCFFCQHDLPGHCEESNPEKYGPEGGLMDQKGGALFGYTDFYGGYDGGQAEYVRVPYANVGPRKAPEEFSDDQLRRYGYRRLAQELTDRGVLCAPARIRRIMTQRGLHAIQPKTFV
ncbi:MAG: alcohol dehydrogenase catalytic domain-containing protein, partial [Terrimicrobiaceae bacterium]|nr:alcohol dehydrogenase catalytic domain-containing protein [Terrimicrobiaceae bacterium]